MSYETTMSFRRSKYFFKYMNKEFDLLDINKDFTNEGNYRLILASHVPSDIYSCIDEYGRLDVDSVDFVELPISDEYTNNDNVEMPYFNLKVTPIADWEGGFIISLASGTSDIQIKVGDANESLTGMFLVRRANNFVLSYAYTNSPVNVKNFFTLPFDSELLSVGSCNKYSG